jgi:hypothetical protein
MTSLPTSIVRSEPRNVIVGTGEVCLPAGIEQAGDRARRRFLGFRHR